MPRTIVYAHNLIPLYLIEARFTNSEEMVTRGIVNRWVAYLQDGCSEPCCEHRNGRTVQPHMAERADGVDYLHHLMLTGKAVATRNNARTKLRKFYDWMIATNEMGKVKKKVLPNPFATIKGDKPQRNVQPVMREDAFEKMMKACDEGADEVIARRDRAILSLLMWSGLRREEITKLDRGSYRNEVPGRPMMIVGSVQRTTKKKRARLVPMAPDTAAYLDRYLLRRDAGYVEDADSPLFMSQRGDRLTAQGISQLFDRKKKVAGIEGPLGVHAMRRGWVIAMKRAKMSDHDIAKCAGWMKDDGSVNVAMVSYYLQSDADDMAYDAYFSLVAPLASKLQDKAKAKGAKPGKYAKRAA